MNLSSFFFVFLLSSPIVYNLVHESFFFNLERLLNKPKMKAQGWLVYN